MEFYFVIKELYAWICKNNMGLYQEKTCLRVCEQQRRRPACASAQSDQHLVYLLIRQYQI